jgi:hypothetical protein
VRGADGGSGENIPLRIVPERGKVAEDPIGAGAEQSGDVLDEHRARADFADDPRVLAPEPRPSSGKTSALPGNTEVLAREAPADDVDGLGRSDGPDVPEVRDPRESSRKNS